jgi:hypothetical protein
MNPFDPSHAVHYFGKYKGFVRDNSDKEGRGRVRVYCPQVMGIEDDKDHWLDWAEPCFPWIGGLSALDFGVPPTPGENGNESVGVWIEFEAGEVDHPIWSGTFVYAPVTESTIGSICPRRLRLLGAP